MKLIILSALVVMATASGYGVGGGGYGIGGASIDYHAIPDYSTASAVRDAYSGVDTAQNENRLGHKTEGSYRVALPDGRIQVVRYWVDGDSGYNAQVDYIGHAVHPAPVYGYGH